MSLKSIVVATLMAATGCAYASGDLNTLADGSTTTFVGAGLVGNNWIDYTNFTITGPSTVTGGVGGGAASFTYNTPFGSVFLNGIATLSGITLQQVGGPYSASDADLTDGFSFTGLGAGTYKLGVTGSTLGNFGAYAGNITVSAVPEPETYAMMLAGLGVMGFIARRRKAA